MISSKTLGQKYLNAEQVQWLIVAFGLCIFIGFVGSRALVSIGMIGILAVSLYYHGIMDTLRAYYQKKEFLVVSLYFWLVFISGFYSEDISGWWNWTRIKLPYIILPLAFAPLGRLSDKKFKLLLYGFIATFVVSAILVLGRYYLDFRQLTEAFQKGGALPMPYSHIRYTLMLAFSFFAALYLIQGKNLLADTKGKWALWAVAVFTVIALHVLTVRSGLVALYIGVLYLTALEVIRRKRFLLGFAIVITLATLPFLANRFIPSFHNKMEYMRYDLKQYRKGNINEHSDAMRLLSMEVGLKEWKQNILFGVGSGDIKREADRIYASEYPQISEQNRRLPHNQFIWVLAISGVVGLAAFLVAFFVPWFATGYYKHWLFTVLHLMLLSSFFTEHTFEEQMGTGFYAIFLMLFMNRFQGNE